MLRELGLNKKKNLLKFQFSPFWNFCHHEEKINFGNDFIRPISFVILKKST